MGERHSEKPLSLGDPDQTTPSPALLHTGGASWGQLVTGGAGLTVTMTCGLSWYLLDKNGMLNCCDAQEFVLLKRLTVHPVKKLWTQAWKVSQP